MSTKLIVLLMGMVLVLVALLFFTGDDESEVVVIGTKPFNEQYIFAEVVSTLLNEEGYETKVRKGLGGTFANYEALRKGQVDIYLEYTGTAYNVIFKLPPPERWEAEEIHRAVEKELRDRDGVHIIASPGFSNDYVLAARSSWVEDNGVRDMSDLSAQSLILGTDPEFASRADGLALLEEVYGISFREVRQMQPTLMYEAIAQGHVDVITAYTTDGRLELFDLEIIRDDRGAFPPYEAILLANERIAGDEKVVEALSVLDSAMDTETMLSLNYQYDVEKRDARDIARDFLLKVKLVG